MRLSNKFCSLQKVLVNVSLQISTALSLTLKIVMTRTLICTGIICRIECGDFSIERMAVFAVKYADTLIKELQKKGTNNENDRFSW